MSGIHTHTYAYVQVYINTHIQYILYIWRNTRECPCIGLQWWWPVVFAAGEAGAGGSVNGDRFFVFLATQT